MSRLGVALFQWLRSNPSWSMRPDTRVDAGDRYPAAPTQHATYQEIAQRLLDDPEIRAALEELGKGAERSISTAVSEQGLSLEHTQLLETVLGIAATSTRGHRRRLMRRAEAVLVGALAAAGVVVWIARS